MVHGYGMRARLTTGALAALLLAGSVFQNGCVTTTTFSVDPPAADIWVNGQYIGKGGDAKWRTRSGLPDEAEVRIACDGYEPVKATIEKQYVGKTWPFLLIVIFPYFIFGAAYEDSYDFRMRAIPGAPHTGAMPPAAPASPNAPFPAPPAQPAQPQPPR